MLTTYGSNANLVPTLTAMGKIPGSARGPGNTIVSPYGGNITILGNGRRFQIEVEDLSDEQCFNLGKRFADNAGTEFGVVNIRAGNTAFTGVFSGTPVSRTLAQVNTACGGGGVRNHLAITFR